MYFIRNCSIIINHRRWRKIRLIWLASAWKLVRRRACSVCERKGREDGGEDEEEEEEEEAEEEEVEE